MLASIYRWLAWGAVSVALVGTLCGLAYIRGDDHGQGVVRAQDAKAQKAVYAAFEWNLANGQRLATELSHLNTARTAYMQPVLLEISNDTLPTVAAPGAPAAAPLLTARAVCLWNRAWAGDDVPGGLAAAGADAGAACPGPDDESASGFDVRDALYSDGRAADACWTWIGELRQLHQYELDRAAHNAGKH